MGVRRGDQIFSKIDDSGRKGLCGVIFIARNCDTRLPRVVVASDEVEIRRSPRRERTRGTMRGIARIGGVSLVPGDPRGPQSVP